MTPEEVCAKLAQWADVADLQAGGDRGSLVILKSDLLGRLIFEGEKGPSQTPCPVHKGKWSGMHLGWPDTFWTSFATGEKTPVEISPMLQGYWDDGCRCATHKGSTCTTGWNPDEHCGCGAAAKTEDT